MNKQQMIEKLGNFQTEFGNCISVDTVIKMINSLETDTTTVQKSFIDDLCDSVFHGLENVIDNDSIIDYNSAEFSIDYNNKIVLDRVDLDINKLTKTVIEIINYSYTEVLTKDPE